MTRVPVRKLRPTKALRLFGGLLFAVLWLAGCGTGVVPTVTPPGPSPVIVTGIQGGSGPTFSLAGGEYAVQWRVTQPNCVDVSIWLIGQDGSTAGWHAEIVNEPSPGAMTSAVPAPDVTGVPGGPYVMVESAGRGPAVCSWTVALTQVR